MHKILAGLVTVFFAFPVFAKTVTLYHTSDTHGFFYPRSGQGGAASLAAVLKSGPKEYLLLDSGDFAEGTLETQRSKGLKAVRLMNALGYHAATVGNHEFAYGDDAFSAMVSAAEFPVLAANLTLSETGEYPSGILPYQIFEVNDAKIAVIGLANRYPNKTVRAYTLGRQLSALKETLSAVEKQNPSAVVVLAHDSLKDDRKGSPNYIGDIARQLGGRVHVVLGGHAHAVFQNEHRGGVLFAESGSNFQNVSKITVKLDDKTGKFVSARSKLIPLVLKKTGEDEAAKTFADSLREAEADVVVGTALSALLKRPSKRKSADSAVDNWVADAMCRYAPADVCIHNTGGGRVGLPKGEVTRRNLIELYPFDNAVVAAQVNGSFLRKLVRSGLTPWNRLAYSGLTVSFKKTKSGDVKNLEIWVNGEKLQDDKAYTVVTNSYIGSGRGEGKLFKTLPQGTVRPAGDKTMRRILEDEFKRGPLAPPKTGRIVQK